MPVFAGNGMMMAEYILTLLSGGRKLTGKMDPRKFPRWMKVCDTKASGNKGQEGPMGIIDQNETGYDQIQTHANSPQNRGRLRSS